MPVETCSRQYSSLEDTTPMSPGLPTKLRVLQSSGNVKLRAVQAPSDDPILCRSARKERRMGIVIPSLLSISANKEAHSSESESSNGSSLKKSSDENNKKRPPEPEGSLSPALKKHPPLTRVGRESFRRPSLLFGRDNSSNKEVLDNKENKFKSSVEKQSSNNDPNKKTSSRQNNDSIKTNSSLNTDNKEALKLENISNNLTSSFGRSSAIPISRSSTLRIITTLRSTIDPISKTNQLDENTAKSKIPIIAPASKIPATPETTKRDNTDQNKGDELNCNEPKTTETKIKPDDVSSIDSITACSAKIFTQIQGVSTASYFILRLIMILVISLIKINGIQITCNKLFRSFFWHFTSTLN